MKNKVSNFLFIGLTVAFGYVLHLVLSIGSLSTFHSPKLVERKLDVNQTLSSPNLEQKRQYPENEQKKQYTKTSGGHRLTVPLQDLVSTQKETSCAEGMILITDVIRSIGDNKTNASSFTLKHRKIPRIIHVTSKSRCVTKNIAEAIDRWKQYGDHEFFFHNDAALHRLLFEQDWPEFPQIRLALDCATGMVQQADLWRAVVIWQYGGIYTDIDNIPKGFNPSKTLSESDEAYFEVETGGWLSQYFFAAAPKHPLMFLLVFHVLMRLYSLDDYTYQYAPYHTGPGALKNAMKHFMQTHTSPEVAGKPWLTFEKVVAGHYTGLANATVTVAPKASAVHRAWVKTKGGDYRAMNMTHFSKIRRFKSNQSCMNELFLKNWLNTWKTTNKEWLQKVRK